jgi:glycosyltransferase involved in cell wall biosynthesis
MNRTRIFQINLSPTLGGAEVYTAFFSRALAAHGWPTRVIVDARARFWDELDLSNVEICRVNGASAVPAVVENNSVVVVHAPLAPAVLHQLVAHSALIGVAHQALYSKQRPAYYDLAALLLPVSAHVLATLKRHGIDRVYPTPLYSVSDSYRNAANIALRQGPLCEWDNRKLRDRFMAVSDRARASLSGAMHFQRRAGLTLGLVSRIAPLKQFPALFERLAPLIARRPHTYLEVFGAAVGYKSLRDLRAALGPMLPHTRFWGHQSNVAAAYRSIDYLLTGLPEREALGLNVVESAALGTPVLAIDAPPFTETMQTGKTGFLYVDPRQDAGADFARVLDGIRDGTLRPDLAGAAPHLEKFSRAAFGRRVDVAMHVVVAALRAG